MVKPVPLSILLGIRGFDLQDEPVDLFGTKLAAVLRHAALAIVNDVPKIIGGSGYNLR
jgi:hypothetical protein